MYFWNIDKLTQELMEGSLSENESFKYLIASTIVYGIVTIPFFEHNMLDTSSAIIGGVINIVGAFYIFQCNRGGNGKSLLQRYISIGWVVCIRWLALIVLPTFIIYYAFLEISFEIPDETTIQEVLLSNIVLIAYFWSFGKHIKLVANSDNA
ncbi:hypothetical protein [Candidatus Albibeggiatoa sp. nov. NOAA]|uniref:hypothetical protein n=1 Tax=Candidatus Albibeggiatoa sp. nov. NOAA TaxID=3162724 RepID=UPI00330266DC|nr:hypothetical protein [Thiotrichaceae bacterium]